MASGSGGSYLSMASTVSIGSKLPNRREYTEVKDLEGGEGGGGSAQPGRLSNGTSKKAVAAAAEERGHQRSGSDGRR